MLTVKSKVREYIRNGSPVFVYALAGSKEELAEYKKTQGDYYREEEKTKEPLFFSPRPIATGTQLAPNREGTRFVVQQDLEAQVAATETAKNAQLGKLQAMQEFLGLTKAQMQQMLLGQLSI